jgi:hypothetical protein
MTWSEKSNGLKAWVVALYLCAGILYAGSAMSSGAPALPSMPAHWKVVTDDLLQEQQVQTIGARLGADLNGVRNTTYAVNGKLVQLNVLAAADSNNAEKLMTALRSIKTEEALLRKGTVVYEFVGENDVLPLIMEGRSHLNSM